MLYHVKASHKQVGDGYVAGEAGQSGISHDARERLCLFFFFLLFSCLLLIYKEDNPPRASNTQLNK